MGERRTAVGQRSSSPADKFFSNVPGEDADGLHSTRRPQGNLWAAVAAQSSCAAGVLSQRIALVVHYCHGFRLYYNNSQVIMAFTKSLWYLRRSELPGRRNDLAHGYTEMFQCTRQKNRARLANGGRVSRLCMKSSSHMHWWGSIERSNPSHHPTSGPPYCSSKFLEL